MKITMKTKIGKNELSVDFEKMSDVHKFGGIYGNLPKVCDACKSENIYLSYRNINDNEYFSMGCGDCGANANFGIHKNGKGLFWKSAKMEVYVPPTGQEPFDQPGQAYSQNQELPY